MFPNYKKKFLVFKVTDGWEDLGEVDCYYDLERGALTILIHSLCSRVIKIGRENGELFKFCPRCMVKIELKSEPYKPKRIVNRKLVD